MSAPRRGLARTIVHTLATIGLGAGAQILAGIATARAFGPAGKGILSYAGVLATFAVAAAEGLRNGLIYEAGTQGTPLGTAWRRTLPLVTLVAPLGTLLFYVLWRRDPAQLAFLFVALAFPFALFLQAVNGVYVVRHAIERLNTQNAWTVGAGSALATLVAVAAFHAPLVVALSIWLAGFVLAAAWAAFGARRLFTEPAGSVVLAPGGMRSARERAIFGVKGGLSACVTLLALRIDLLLVGALLPPDALGIYAIAVALGELPWMLSRAVTWSTTARIGTDDFAAAATLTAKVVRFLFAFQCAAALVVAIAATLLVPIVYGVRFAAAAPLVYILLPRLIAYGADGVLSYFIAVRAGHPGTLLAFEAGTLTLCGALAAAGIVRFGLVGAALGATLAFVLAIGGKLAYFRGLTGIGVRDLVVVRRGDVPETVAVRLPSFLRTVVAPRA